MLDLTVDHCALAGSLLADGNVSANVGRRWLELSDHAWHRADACSLFGWALASFGTLDVGKY